MKYQSLSTITVGQFQELHSIHASEDDTLDKSVRLVSMFTGLPRWEVEDLPYQDFQRMAAEIVLYVSSDHPTSRLKRKVKIGGKKYRVCLNAKDITVEQWIDVQHFMKGGDIANLHHIIACLVIPTNWYAKEQYDGTDHDEVAEAIKGLRYADVHAIWVFFSLLWNRSIGVIQGYLEKQLQTSPTTRDLYNQIHLQKLLDGCLVQEK